jgi:SSS family solute:Na+ symporter
MTLYQRIFASRDVKSARKAWFIAGLFEWPIMAFMGVALGLLARVSFEQGLLLVNTEMLDPEMGIPILLRTILPPGILGLMMAAYFSAVLSTADSCLMAASGNLTTDIFGKWMKFKNEKIQMRYSQLFTLILGILALVISLQMTNVLELMLYSYAFMVSGLFVPIIFGLFTKNRNPQAAIASMVSGGMVTLILGIFKTQLPLGLDANFYGISVALMVYLLVSRLRKPTNQIKFKTYA